MCQTHHIKRAEEMLSQLEAKLAIDSTAWVRTRNDQLESNLKRVYDGYAITKFQMRFRILAQLLVSDLRAINEYEASTLGKMFSGIDRDVFGGATKKDDNLAFMEEALRGLADDFCNMIQAEQTLEERAAES